jgi:D-alanyl-D-alanine carboxypeptidase (penicillin-binding protein 5/6)
MLCRLLGCLLLAAVAATLPASGAAQAVPEAPKVSADTYVVMEAATGQLLAAKKPDKRKLPASLTKLMTAYVVYDAIADGSIALDDEVLISEKAWKMEGSKMFLEPDTRATVDQLLDGLVVQSGNDAAVALAEHTAGSVGAFAELMNHYADELGLDNTHFRNPEGMPVDEHYSSARDLAVLSRAIIRDFPEHYERYSKRKFTYNNIEQYNRNDLLFSDSAVDGLKTGYTREAGYSLAASAKRNDMRLISVVMDAPTANDRVSDVRSLLSWGFRFYERHELYPAGEVLKDAPIWYGPRNSIELGLAESLFVTIPKGAYDALEAEMALPGQLSAPTQKGARMGTVRVYHDGEAVAQAPLVALEEVAAGNLFQRATDRVLWWLR